MTHHLRTLTYTTLIGTIVALVPLFVYAQQPIPITHPTSTPPTPAPSAPLPVTTLPNGAMTVTVTSTTSVANKPTTSVVAPIGQGSAATSTTSTEGDVTMLYALVGVGVLILFGLGWFFIPRRHDPAPTEMPENTY